MAVPQIQLGGADLVAFTAVLVTLVSIIVHALLVRGGWRREERREQRQAHGERARDHHARMAAAYGDAHRAVFQLLVSLGVYEAWRVPRILRAVVALGMFRKGSVVRELGHRRAMLELHGAPGDGLAAWKTLDDATIDLVDADATPPACEGEDDVSGEHECRPAHVQAGQVLSCCTDPLDPQVM